MPRRALTTETLIERFAKERRLKTAKQNCGDFIEITIPGRQGQIYEYDDQTLAVMFFPAKRAPKTYGNFKRKALPLGMTLLQDGDSEGCLSFSPKDKEQVKLAIQIGKVRAKRQMSPEQALAVATRLAAARKTSQISLQKGS